MMTKFNTRKIVVTLDVKKGGRNVHHYNVHGHFTARDSGAVKCLRLWKSQHLRYFMKNLWEISNEKKGIHDGRYWGVIVTVPYLRPGYDMGDMRELEKEIEQATSQRIDFEGRGVDESFNDSHFIYLFGSAREAQRVIARLNKIPDLAPSMGLLEVFFFVSTHGFKFED